MCFGRPRDPMAGYVPVDYGPLPSLTDSGGGSEMRPGSGYDDIEVESSQLQAALRPRRSLLLRVGD